MTNIEKHFNEFKKHRLSTIVRTNDYDHAMKIIEGSIAGGINFIELTLTIPNVFELIKEARKRFPDANIGAGTVLTIDDAKKSIAAGATYLVDPVCDVELLKWCNEQDVLLIASGATPTEMYNLQMGGAKIIKFFPAMIGGPEMVKLILNPFPQFNLLATAGPNQSNMDEYFKAGVLGCGITADLGGAPVGTSLEEITEIAKKYVAITAKYL
ncbi:bifunctional 4-hydroxy-2-oxoglutarate aldolase/2-dehydro-3-deoxy-phosphogluconate aldolase [Mesoplasma lactucae]|nr:bifunctional 4-hydroxy-2-oxoglutarate aldolase/2-dehydro-3-deoxy-phosphogluconate aldolase [Mesoplasma lactucae]ATZ20472.1 2-dehydro-3-deoxy-phosphogluconate aldolase [Mesoplasma lactucae ATCC 49193]MCL8216644.1 KHG/KDPG aldolase [Mesoplasma lactucae ATCC 49193]